MSVTDLADVLAWRNADNVRRNMLSDKVISMAEHEAWFARCQVDPSCEWLIAEIAGKPVSVAGITDIDQADLTATWSMYLTDIVTAPGIGALVEYHVIERMIGKHGIRKIWGETLCSNRSTLKLHRRFGFSEEGILRQQVRRNNSYEDVVRVALFAEEWKKRRARIAAMLRPQQRQLSETKTSN